MKISKIEKIVMYTENLATIEFSGEELLKLKFFNVTEENGEYFCDKAKIIIDKKANNSMKYVIGDYHALNSNDDLFEKIIETPNIQDIVVFKKDKRKKVVVPYDMITYDRNGTNSFQKAYLDVLGNLVIIIKEGEEQYG